MSEAGGLSLNPRTQPNAKVVLRFEMDTIVALHTCPHPLHPGGADYPRADIGYRLFVAPPVLDTDPCRTACEENERGFRNNELMHLGR